MTILLKQVFALIRLLNSETGERSIAAGMALGMILAFSPWLSLQAILVFLMILLFRVQAGAAFLTAFFLKFLFLLLSPLLDVLGQVVLEMPALQGIWTALYQAPLIPMTRFHHSVVMGGALLGLILVAPGYFFFRTLVRKYRKQIRDRFSRTRFWKWARATRFVQLYLKYEQVRGMAT